MFKSEMLKSSGISHGWIRPVYHPELGVEINGQSVVRYLRFGQIVNVNALELKPIVSGRWVPGVPTHLAHIIVSIPDLNTGQWIVIKDVDLPRDPRIAGEGLNQNMSIEEMDNILSESLKNIHRIEFSEIQTDVIRVECDREYLVWPNHGECNGAPYSVPFGALDSLTAFGSSNTVDKKLPEYLPPLQVGSICPAAPEKMTVEQLPWLVKFCSEKFSIGFSLVRPEILHLGWDGVGGNRAGENRVRASSAGFQGGQGLFSGQSGPILRTSFGDFGSNCWTGSVDIDGNNIYYRNLDCGQGIIIDAHFIVSEDGFSIEIKQHVEKSIHVIEIEGWRLAWNCASAMTAPAAIPTLKPGRNGDVELPMFWAGDGNGALQCENVDGDAYLQVDSYRCMNAVTGGIIMGSRIMDDICPIVPAGTYTSKWNYKVTAFEPVTNGNDNDKVSSALRRHWGSIYSCFRPEYGGFSNNAVSVNCHVNQGHPAETVVFTQKPINGPDPLELYRFTIERGLLGGGGYGFWRNLYLDSDPILVSGAGRIYQAKPDIKWLNKIKPGLIKATERMLNSFGDEGLVVCHDLSGNSSSFRWSSNAMDVVGYGHMDAYVNAWTYRGLRNAASMLKALDCNELSVRCIEFAEKLKNAYSTFLLNPETGWIAGWRSRDGQLHDAAYLWVNGVACAFGLLPFDEAKEALHRLEKLRNDVGAGNACFGIPFNLRPISVEDHMLPQLYGRFTPTFENYTDGAMSPCSAMYYMRALSIYGLNDEAAKIAADIGLGYERGHFNGGVGSGVEFYRWDGVPTGYEGTFVANWGPLYAIAIQHGLIKPNEPEWWPG